MKFQIYVPLVATLLLWNCSTFKQHLAHSGGPNEAIMNAILDYSKTSKSFKTDSAFNVSYIDTVCRMVLRKVDDVNYKWERGTVQEGLQAVSISSNLNRFLITPTTFIGSTGKLPSRYFESDGKIFVWRDDSYPLTEETLGILQKYNLLQSDSSGLLTVPDFITNDAQKGTHYYFCTSDLAKYKKTITSKGIGFYDPPVLKCNKR
jgi:hypothetical protein